MVFVVAIVAHAEQVSLNLCLEPLDLILAPGVVADDLDLDVGSRVELVVVDGYV